MFADRRADVSSGGRRVDVQHGEPVAVGGRGVCPPSVVRQLLKNWAATDVAIELYAPYG